MNARRGKTAYPAPGAELSKAAVIRYTHTALPGASAHSVGSQCVVGISLLCLPVPYPCRAATGWGSLFNQIAATCQEHAAIPYGCTGSGRPSPTVAAQHERLCRLSRPPMHAE